MSGEELKKHIDNAGVHYSEVARALGKNERTVYRLFDKPVIEEYILKKVETLGVKLTIFDKSELGYPSLKVMQESIELIRELFDLIKEDHKLHQEILKKAVADDNLKMTKKLHM